MNARTVRQTTDLLQGVGEADRISRELDRRSVGEELALSGNGSLDQTAEERACAAQSVNNRANEAADEKQSEASLFQVVRLRIPRHAPARDFKQPLANHSNPENAV